MTDRCPQTRPTYTTSKHFSHTNNCLDGYATHGSQQQTPPVYALRQACQQTEYPAAVEKRRGVNSRQPLQAAKIPQPQWTRTKVLQGEQHNKPNQERHRETKFDPCKHHHNTKHLQKQVRYQNPHIHYPLTYCTTEKCSDNAKAANSRALWHKDPDKHQPAAGQIKIDKRRTTHHPKHGGIWDRTSKRYPRQRMTPPTPIPAVATPNQDSRIRRRGRPKNEKHNTCRNKGGCTESEVHIRHRNRSSCTRNEEHIRSRNRRPPRDVAVTPTIASPNEQYTSFCRSIRTQSGHRQNTSRNRENKTEEKIKTHRMQDRARTTNKSAKQASMHAEKDKTTQIQRGSITPKLPKVAQTTAITWDAQCEPPSQHARRPKSAEETRNVGTRPPHIYHTKKNKGQRRECCHDEHQIQQQDPPRSTTPTHQQDTRSLEIESNTDNKGVVNANRATYPATANVTLATTNSHHQQPHPKYKSTCLSTSKHHSSTPQSHALTLSPTRYCCPPYCSQFSQHCLSQKASLSIHRQTLFPFCTLVDTATSK